MPKGFRPKQSPLPPSIYALLLMGMCEPFAQIFIYPFLPHMVQSFGDTSINIPLQIGLIGSAYALGQVLSGGMWSYLALTGGKRNVILVGLVGSATTSILFGLFVDNLYLAMGSRFLWGFMNGHVGVIKVRFWCRISPSSICNAGSLQHTYIYIVDDLPMPSLIENVDAIGKIQHNLNH